MAYGDITEETVHLCTGKPLRSDISQIANVLLNMDFQSAFNGKRNFNHNLCVFLIIWKI